MLKKFGLTALALIMSLGALSSVEAADQSQNDYCCRGSYCYNQNYDRDQNDQNCGPYCCNRQRGCW